MVRNTNSKPFRGVQIHPYLNLDIRHSIPYPYQNTKIALYDVDIHSYPIDIADTIRIQIRTRIENITTNIIPAILVRIRSVCTPNRRLGTLTVDRFVELHLEKGRGYASIRSRLAQLNFTSKAIFFVFSFTSSFFNKSKVV
jgi:hypothetical protein